MVSLLAAMPVAFQCPGQVDGVRRLLFVDVGPNDQPHLAVVAFQEDRGVGTVPDAHAFRVNDESEIAVVDMIVTLLVAGDVSRTSARATVARMRDDSVRLLGIRFLRWLCFVVGVRRL